MQWRRLNRKRRLEISVGGRWYIALTLLVGVAAINSGNNVIYLMESLLLSMLIFSGVLSELAVQKTEIRRRTGRAVAGKTVPDRIDVINHSRFSVFCLEIGEWRGGKFHPIAFVPRIGAGKSTIVRSEQVFAERGRMRWQGIALATSFPFGFGRKIRVIDEPGERIVWPTPHLDSALAAQRRRRENLEIREGEVRELGEGDDLRLVHWPATLKRGRLTGRVRGVAEAWYRVELSTGKSDPDLERKISRAAYAFQRGHIAAHTLVLRFDDSRSVVSGRSAVLDRLALLGKEGA